MKRVVVLGCGPAGLLAAHAASMDGADVQIFSMKRKSYISGAQYLHRPIPGLTNGPDGFITYMKSGQKEAYAHKVYGDSSVPVSWDNFEAGDTRPAYSMRKIYDLLWDMYSEGIHEYHIDKPLDVYNLQDLHADLQVTSIPLPRICAANGNHWFMSVEMWIRDGFAPGVIIPENSIMYNGWMSMPWHRASNLFGHQSMEYGMGRVPKDMDLESGFVHGLKPTEHNCDCHPTWLKVGRFGQWKRGVLVHHAYEEVERALQQV